MNGELSALYAAETERLKAVALSGRNDGEYLRPVFGCGNADSPIVFIGEAPGANETEQGMPFVGKAGRQLDELLELADIPRKEVFITNVVKYRPVVRSERSVRNRTPSAGEVTASLPLLRAEMERIRPRLIITLGNTPLTAVRTLSGELPATVGDVHGRPLPVSLGGIRTVLYPMYHPASGIYNRALIEVMREDAKKIRDIVF